MNNSRAVAVPTKYGMISFWLLISILLLLPGVIRAVDFNINDEAARQAYIRSIPRTIWPEQDGKKPTTYEQWQARVGKSGAFTIELISESKTALKGDPVGFAIIVNTALYPGIESSIDQYIIDLTADVYDVKLFTSEGGTPMQFRQFLQTEYAEGMEGCLLIGDLPVAWYETYCWDEYDSFPCDLYYMDLDGEWGDDDSDGLFDSHSGDRVPEIWLGRLTASTLAYGGAGEATLVNNYFVKNHNYRTGQSSLRFRSLAFIDDDWESAAPDWAGALGQVYDTQTVYTSGAATVDYNYEAELANNYEAILLCSHSSPNCHYFKIGNQWTGGTTCYDEVTTIDPQVYFYNLFACSNARYVEYDYMGGWYVFCDTYGLASVGSTKTGSMLYFEYFYGPFAMGRTYGEAFHDWFTVVNGWGFDQEMLCWFYGMTLCGDPTLKHSGSVPVSITITSVANGTMNVAYIDTLEAEGGYPPYVWSVISGQLPDGLDLNALSGIISGVPTAVGTFEFTIQALDSKIPPNTDTQEYSIEINMICGDANGSGGINILDVTFLIAYLYTEGPDPVPYIIADTNGSGAVNILDVTYLINYLYKSGPAPLCD
nr:putative Ig domain-containing protein [candidate division Zixibacteria bacterium]